ncbi:hypothetical protein Nepgr_027722 [Nepenthes gracilis]|uniref:Uncharacterized protein n=1 Tax=Nepenthes gracilis TaxID=150966 RepID=A0AAD3TBF8_NEPGR|nr:hypothetical protein Nepgr_027722 [Nepenthes gracilis]
MSTKLQYPVTGVEVAAEDRPAGDGGFCNGPAGRGGAVGVNEMLPMLVHSAAVSVASDAWNAGSHDSVMMLVANVMEMLIVHVPAVTWMIWNLDRLLGW